MFNLSQKYTVDGPILICDFNRLTPHSLNPVNRENKQIFIVSLRENSAISLRRKTMNVSKMFSMKISTFQMSLFLKEKIEVLSIA